MASEESERKSNHIFLRKGTALRKLIEIAFTKVFLLTLCSSVHAAPVGPYELFRGCSNLSGLRSETYSQTILLNFLNKTKANLDRLPRCTETIQNTPPKSELHSVDVCKSSMAYYQRSWKMPWSICCLAKSEGNNQGAGCCS